MSSETIQLPVLSVGDRCVRKVDFQSTNTFSDSPSVLRVEEKLANGDVRVSVHPPEGSFRSDVTKHSYRYIVFHW